jgi:hypothetical protein
MPKRRRLLLSVIAAVTLSLIGAAVYWSIPPKPGLTLDNFRFLHRGMTQEQVVAVLASEGEAGGISTLYWHRGDITVVIRFDALPNGTARDGKYLDFDAPGDGSALGEGVDGLVIGLTREFPDRPPTKLPVLAVRTPRQQLGAREE